MNKTASLALAVLLALLGVALGYALLSLPAQTPGLGEAVSRHMADSGVDHTVTAVLLNFRGYDTLLEMAVLLLALLGAWSLMPQSGTEPSALDIGPVLTTLFGLLTPVMLLVAGYLLWVGAHAPGGAFQAGSVLAAAGVLAVLCGKPLGGPLAGWPLRLGLALGTAMFVAVAATLMLAGAQLLQYPIPWAGGLILLIEAAATLSIGLTLTALFFGERPGPKP